MSEVLSWKQNAIPQVSAAGGTEQGSPLQSAGKYRVFCTALLDSVLSWVASEGVAKERDEN